MIRRIEKLIHDAEGRLKFYKMITPRQPSKVAENTTYMYEMYNFFYYSVDENGKLVEGHGKCANEYRLI